MLFTKAKDKQISYTIQIAKYNRFQNCLGLCLRSNGIAVKR